MRRKHAGIRAVVGEQPQQVGFDVDVERVRLTVIQVQRYIPLSARYVVKVRRYAFDRIQTHGLSRPLIEKREFTVLELLIVQTAC